MTFKLLIADDEREVAEVVAFGARMNWPNCEVIIASTGAEALQRFEEEQPNMVVLDINLPPPDGFEVCQRIRDVSQVPILMLTARASTLDKIRALDLGADDYLTKPFDPLELLARLRALVRRSSPAPVQSGHKGHAPHNADVLFGELSIQFNTRDVQVGGQSIALTSTEYRLLEELAKHAGTVLPHQFLLERVWGPEYVGEDHYLKVFVRRLRRKLGDDAEHPRYIQTEWGVGYRFVPVNWASNTYTGCKMP